MTEGIRKRWSARPVSRARQLLLLRARSVVDPAGAVREHARPRGALRPGRTRELAEASQIAKRSNSEASRSNDLPASGHRTYKLPSSTTSEYGRCVKSPGEPVTDEKHNHHRESSCHLIPSFGRSALPGMDGRIGISKAHCTPLDSRIPARKGNRGSREQVGGRRQKLETGCDDSS